MRSPSCRDHSIVRQARIRYIACGTHGCMLDFGQMRTASIACALGLNLALLGAHAQTASQIQTSALGFTYTLPSDWQILTAASTLPSVKDQAQQNAASDEEKKGVACVQVALTARHGDPASVLVIAQLPFDCFGQSMSAKDLPGFAQGASEGIKQSLDLSNSSNVSYSLGGHSMWVERSKGAPKGHPESTYTVEIACTVLKKGAVCWMAMAASDDALKALENSPVELEGEKPAALIPANAFEKKPVL